MESDVRDGGINDLSAAAISFRIAASSVVLLPAEKPVADKVQTIAVIANR
jgi:hypothetical protein